MQASPFPFYLIFLRPKYPSQQLSLRFFLNVIDRVLHSYKTTYKITTKNDSGINNGPFSPSDFTLFDSLSATNFTVYCTLLKLWSRLHSLHSTGLALTFRRMLKFQCIL